MSLNSQTHLSNEVWSIILNNSFRMMECFRYFVFIVQKCQAEQNNPMTHMYVQFNSGNKNLVYCAYQNKEKWKGECLMGVGVSPLANTNKYTRYYAQCWKAWQLDFSFFLSFFYSHSSKLEENLCHFTFQMMMISFTDLHCQMIHNCQSKTSYTHIQLIKHIQKHNIQL